MSEQIFKAGEVVLLKSGGPKMTVIGYEPSDSMDVLCTWFVDKESKEKSFPQDVLQKYEYRGITAGRPRRNNHF